jgi:hypothetical protein
MLLPLISAVIKSSMGWVFWGGLIFLDIDRSRREVAGSQPENILRLSL